MNRRREIIAVLVIAGLAAAAGMITLAGSHDGAPSAAATPGPTTSVPAPPPPTATDATRFTGLEDVDSMGQLQFPDTFAGAYARRNGPMLIYTTTPNDPILQAAVAKLNTTHQPVRFVRCRLSYRRLNALTQALAGRTDQLRLVKDGVYPVEWGPRAPYNAVPVTLRRPTSRDLVRLSASGLVPARLTPVTRTDYLAAAGAVITAVAGPGYAIQQGFGTVAHAD